MCVCDGMNGTRPGAQEPKSQVVATIEKATIYRGVVERRVITAGQEHTRGHRGHHGEVLSAVRSLARCLHSDRACGQGLGHATMKSANPSPSNVPSHLKQTQSLV
ncbi:hypothetical protein BAUCODRAFT_163750 [Baudoinia panamericana UAMH 10762]|uniref:Uncharacterized protein n=1 Tax=Baudoinia panamericana (strain UAMH 10762) TaxID=717646 RepID=M2NMK4_BAUPA|nr:uncharacterized protein BAUCODRAFT_163750 [Baudoinia panamericana UAMH 10762]EMD00416.1 hypothetical protein BAUCODRAFT_163750 [Baudoinia panamericana UAMH 10762]